MANSNLLVDGLQLMVLGMSVVFLFLGILVAAMHATARLVRGIETRRSSTTAHESAASQAEPDWAMLAAISVAVQRYRRTHTF